MFDINATKLCWPVLSSKDVEWYLKMLIYRNLKTWSQTVRIVIPWIRGEEITKTNQNREGGIYSRLFRKNHKRCQDFMDKFFEKCAKELSKVISFQDWFESCTAKYN